MYLGPEAIPEEFHPSLVHTSLPFSHGWKQLDEKELSGSIIPARPPYLLQVFQFKVTPDLHQVSQCAFSL